MTKDEYIEFLRGRRSLYLEHMALLDTNSCTYHGYREVIDELNTIIDELENVVKEGTKLENFGSEPE